jgi:putative ABC transport system permease protein
MRGGAVGRAVRGGLSRRRVVAVTIGLVLLVSTGASVLALGLLVDSHAPFDHAFAAQRGAHVTAVVKTSRASAADLAATARLPRVSAAAGPYPVTVVQSEQGGQAMPLMTLAGRASPGGAVDDIVLRSGHWARGPGQIVLARDPAPGEIMVMPIGSRLTVTGIPGRPVLTVVGLATSATSTAAGWVLPGEIARLTPPGAPASAQMLYRFRDAGSAAAIRADIAAVRSALPPGSLTATQSYLDARTQQTGAIAAFVPFLVAFGVIGLVMSVLIVANVISGAVVAGYRRIGVLKSVGFTPGQVVAAYAGQITVPAVIGCVGGVVFGNLLASPLLAKTASVYGVGSLTVPVWVDVAVPVTMLALAAAAAMAPASRAGRLSAVQAIAAGRAPRAGHGFAAQRVLARARLPRPVTLGLAAPFARPARTAVTLTAVLLGATAVTFAVGLGSSLSRVVSGLSLTSTEPVQVGLPLAPGNQDGPDGPPPATASQQATAVAAIRALPGTGHYVAETDSSVNVVGLTQQIPVTAFRGDAGWIGYPMVSGHWYTGPGQAVVPTGFLRATGDAIGDTVTIIFAGRQVPVRIVGEVFDGQDRGLAMITDYRTLARIGAGQAGGHAASHAASQAAGQAAGQAQPDQYDIGLRPGVSTDAYVSALGRRLGPSYGVMTSGRKSGAVTLMLGLIGTLTLLLAIVAALGVLSTVATSTRERVHDLGVFKALGMTPRQTIAMVVCWVAGTGLAAGVIAIPAGVAVHQFVLPAMAASADLSLPASMMNVYHVWELAALALAGLVIAVAGALLPAGWAASRRTAVALRTE